MKSNLAQSVDFRRVVDATAAGTTAIEGGSVDMLGFDGVLFLAAVGTLTATQVTALKAQQSSDDGSTDAFSDIAGSASAALADTDDNKLVVLDIFRPTKRYVRPVVTRGTANAVVDGVIAILYRAEKTPVLKHTTVALTPKLLNQPAEGTA
jgi:hypothetical protein